jgi:hypothetical protein
MITSLLVSIRIPYHDDDDDTKSESIFQNVVQVFKNSHFTISSYFLINSNSHYNLTYSVSLEIHTLI